MNIRSIILITALLALFSGCAATKQHEPTQLQDIKPTHSLMEKWSAKIGTVDNGGFIPRYFSGDFYSANEDGKIYSFDSLSGAKKGSWSISKTKLSTGIAVTDKVLYVASKDGKLIAFDRSDRKIIWSEPLTSMLLEAPLLMENGVVVVRTNDGRVTGFDSKDGHHLWSNSYVMPQLIVRNTGSMSQVDKNVILVGLPAGHVQAVNTLKGDILWDGVVTNPHGATELERATDIVSRPLFDNGQIFAVAYQGSIACFDINTGNLLWSHDLSSSLGLAFSATDVFTTADDGSVWAFDRTSGKQKWKLNGLMYRGVSAPVMLGENVLVFDAEGYAHLISADSGELIGRLKIGNEKLISPPQAFGDSVLIQDAEGNLAYISLKN